MFAFLMKSWWTFIVGVVLCCSVLKVEAQGDAVSASHNIKLPFYYGGLGISIDTINPRGHTESNLATDIGILKSDFNHMSSGAYLSPHIFIGMEHPAFYKDWALRLQAGADFHTINMEKKKVI